MNSRQYLNDLPKNKSSERDMFTIAQALLEISNNDALRSELPEINRYAENLMEVIKRGDPDAIEHALVNLYIRLHAAGSRYSPSEKEILKKRVGYTCIPGGLSPLLMAQRFIRPESIVADFGAGNGLQGLLLQRICPHKRTLQIEISAEMIRIGRIFQQALGIGDDRVEWINEDILNVSIKDVDFIYIYRPAMPLKGGEEVYQAIARRLEALPRSVVVFSVADCLAKFLDKGFSIFYTDGHLTCFRKMGFPISSSAGLQAL